MENNILYICVTVVILAVVIIFSPRPKKETYKEEILKVQDWSEYSGGIYRRDYTIKRVYSNGTEEIYIKKVRT